MRKFQPILLSLVGLFACGEATVGDECTAANHCNLTTGRPACDAGYAWEDPADDTNLRCVLDATDVCMDDGRTRCEGKVISSCTLGRWTFEKTCEQACEIVEGEAACPSTIVDCQGADVSCNDGNVVECSQRRFQTVQTCAEGCVHLIDQGPACRGGEQGFAPRSVGLAFTGAVLASISTESGAIGCGLVDDYALKPGTAAEQIYIVLANVGFECPVGIYGLDAGCSLDSPGTSTARCAIYRRWGAERLEAIEALSGAVTITEQNGTCTFDIEVVVNGQRMNVGFDANTAGQQTSMHCPTPR